MRTEKIRLSVKLSKASATKYESAIRTVLQFPPPKQDDSDSLLVSYQLFLEYCGNVAERLAALCQILGDQEAVVTADFEELNHGCCLFLRCAALIAEVKEKIAQRKR